MNNIRKCKCPLCNGSGEIEAEIIIKPKNIDMKRAAKKMRKAGFSFRQIAKTLGYDHPGSISHILK